MFTSVIVSYCCPLPKNNNKNLTFNPLFQYFLFLYLPHIPITYPVPRSPPTANPEINRKVPNTTKLETKDKIMFGMEMSTIEVIRVFLRPNL